MALVGSLLARLSPAADREIAIAPPFTALSAVAPLLKGSAVLLAAQDTQHLFQLVSQLSKLLALLLIRIELRFHEAEPNDIEGR